MANDRLRQALQNTGVQPDQLADLVAVDERTVRRWLTGVTPYARHRGQIARALDTTEHDLWPEIPRPVVSDSLAAYTHADDPDAPTTEMLIGVATDRIELLDNTLDGLLETPGLPELLLAKASQGCRIRILVSSPDRSLGPLLGSQQIEIGLIPAPPDPVIHRADDQMLVTFSLDSEPDQPLLLHVRERRAPGLFDRLARHFESRWERTDNTLATERDLDNYLHEHDPDAMPPDDAQGTVVLDQPIRQAAEAPPRHWPRQPQ
jgi:DNA-binding transcriptional regulator YdaS (Cro superfamily)